MLVDSSVWIDALRGTDNPASRVLSAALRQRESVWICAPILQEVLQGADAPSRFEKWATALGDLPFLVDPDPRELAVAAARLYARCRWHGFTPRSPNDCLIAQFAIRFAVPLLHRDRDFERIAEIEPQLVLFQTDVA